jgi:hypothetical protein
MGLKGPLNALGQKGSYNFFVIRHFNIKLNSKRILLNAHFLFEVPLGWYPKVHCLLRVCVFHKKIHVCLILNFVLIAVLNQI